MSASPPDFAIIGAMKAGSTTLFRWLEAHPGTSLGVKEPEFFNRTDPITEPDLDAYRRSIGGDGAGLSGEASVAYLDPVHAATVALRMRRWVPDIKLVCLLRDPIARLRSHYRHQVLRGRERRSLAAALDDPGNEYLRNSLYHTALAPFRVHFGNSLRVIASEELFGESERAWHTLLDFLGLERSPRPTARHNVSRQKQAFRGSMLALWELGVVDKADLLPSPLRAALKRVLLRSPRQTARLVEGADGPIPEVVLDTLRRETRALWREMGWSHPDWPITEYSEK